MKRIASVRVSMVALSLALGLAACGKKEETPAASAPPADPAPATAPAAPATTAAPSADATTTTAAAPAGGDNAIGKSVYNKTCAMCHAAGVAGAPKPGDKADWGPRIAQGDDVLFKHAIEGFTGAKGMMPPRGGGASLSDDEVKAAVRFMVDQSR